MTSIAFPRKRKPRAPKMVPHPFFSQVTISECDGHPAIVSEKPYPIVNLAPDWLREKQGDSDLARYVTAHLPKDLRPVLQFRDAKGQVCDFDTHAQPGAITFANFLEGEGAAGPKAYLFGHPSDATFNLYIKYMPTCSQNTPCIPCIAVTDSDSVIYVPLSLLMNRAKGHVVSVQENIGHSLQWGQHVQNCLANSITPEQMFPKVKKLAARKGMSYVAVILRTAAREQLVFQLKDDSPFLRAAQGAGSQAISDVVYIANEASTYQLLSTPVVSGLTRKASISALVNRLIAAKVLHRDDLTSASDFVGDHEFIIGKNGTSLTLYLLDGVKQGDSDIVFPDYVQFDPQFRVWLNGKMDWVDLG